MNALITLCTCFAAIVLLAAVYIWRRRGSAESRASDSARRRAVLEDCGDDAVWEAGRSRSIVATHGLEPRSGRRMFLKRMALGVSAFVVAWLASRSRAVAAMSLKPRAQSGRNPALMDDHNDQATHNDVTYSPHGDSEAHADVHTDSGGGDHGDLHSDTDEGHTDMPPPHTDDNGHFDM